MFEVHVKFGRENGSGPDWRVVAVMMAALLVALLVLTGKADQLLTFLIDAIKAWRGR